jgi:RNA polymerase sigma-70 factor (sigma-E family)
MVADAEMTRFEEFVNARLPALYRYAVVLTGNRHDAEDLVQEALVRTGLAWRTVQRKDAPEGYVRTTMVRIMANRWRRPRREYPMADVPDRPADDTGPDRISDIALLDSAIRTLPPRMRAVLVLRYVDQLSEAEIAEVLGCRPGTVKSQAARGLAKLRTMLDGESTWTR